MDERVIEIELTAMGNGGEALGRHEGKVVFVAGGIPGEIVEVGITQGRGKKGNRYHHHGRPKTVWLYPLHRHWRQRLTAPEPPPHPPRPNETRSIGEVSEPTPGR